MAFKPLLAFLILFSFGCREHEGNKNIEIATENTTDSLLINWRADSLGCIGYRKKSIGTIFEKYTLVSKDVDEIKRLLGKANEEYLNENYHGLLYYCDNTCINNALPAESDKCWFEIRFNNNGENKTSYNEVCQ